MWASTGARGRPRPARPPRSSPFAGRLTVLPDPGLDPFVRGRECELRVVVGTRGLGQSLRGAAGVAATAFCEPFRAAPSYPPASAECVPAGLNPVAEVEFPAADGKAERVRVVLTRRC